MPIYEFRCNNGHGVCEVTRPMDRSDEPLICSECDCKMQRLLSDFVFLEDRCRFARNPKTGQNFSDMLGQAYPQDRKERDALYAIKGIEPVSASDMPSQWRTAVDYSKHVSSGGARLSPEKEAGLVEKPDMSGVKSIAEMVRESNFRLGE